MKPLVALVPLLAAACTAAPSPPVPAEVGVPVLAFVSGRTVKVSDAAGNTRDVHTMTSDPGPVLWSPDGQRLAWTNTPDDASGTDTVYVHDLTTSATRSYPCPCRGLGFLGADLTTVNANGTHLVVFPAQGEPNRIAFRNPLTTPYTGEDAAASAEVVASGRDQVTVAVNLDEGKILVRAQRTLLAVDRAGSVRPILPGKGDSSARQALGSPTGDRIAWVDSPSSGACWADERMVDVGYSDRHPTDPKPPADEPLRRAHLPDQRTVLSYSWAGTGVVQTFGPVGSECQALYPFRYVSYYRQGSVWTHLATGLLAIAFGANGQTAKLVPDLPIGPPDDDGRIPGRLVLSGPGVRERTLDADVEQFAFTPAQAAAARPVPAGGSPSVPAEPPGVDDHGRELSGALPGLVREVWTAAQAGDRAALLALCRDCDADTRAWLADDGPAEVTRLLATHPGRVDHNRLIYPGLAVAACADTTGAPATCTPEQLADVVTLGLQSEVGSEYPAYGYRVPADRSLVFRLDGETPVWAGRG